MTLLEVVQIIAALADAGKSTVELVDWVEKRRAAGVKDSDTLLPQHEHDARNLVQRALIDDPAEDFINNTLGR